MDGIIVVRFQVRSSVDGAVIADGLRSESTARCYAKEQRPAKIFRIDDDRVARRVRERFVGEVR